MVLVQVITAKSIRFSCRYIPQTEIAGLKVGVFIILLAIAKSSLVHTPSNQEGAAGSPTPSHTWHTAVCSGVGWEVVSCCLLNRPPFLCFEPLYVLRCELFHSFLPFFDPVIGAFLPGLPLFLSIWFLSLLLSTFPC